MDDTVFGAMLDELTHEIDAAHCRLDQAGVPRQIGGHEANLSQRIAYLHGQYTVAVQYEAPIPQAQPLRVIRRRRFQVIS